MNSYFGFYDKLYPDLVMKILEYFDISNTSNGDISNKSVIDFCSKNKEGDRIIYQPQIVNRICKRLCDCGIIEQIRNSKGELWKDNYIFIIRNQELFSKEKTRLKYYYNCIVYGFDYIYEMYKDIVVPLVWDKPEGDPALGTGFKFLNGIVTAKHCLEDVSNLKIRGYKAEELEGKPVYISDKKGIDIAFIETGRIEEPIIYVDNGEVMQEVLVMGYPKIPAFLNFLTAEKASISSIASYRLTPTRGLIAAYGEEFLSNMEAMLITARIRGGNSGGPVINQNGCLVGVACHIVDSDSQNGDYDDLGYGVAVPTSYLTEIINQKSVKLNIPKGFYRDFEE